MHENTLPQCIARDPERPSMRMCRCGTHGRGKCVLHMHMLMHAGARPCVFTHALPCPCVLMHAAFCHNSFTHRPACMCHHACMQCMHACVRAFVPMPSPVPCGTPDGWRYHPHCGCTGRSRPAVPPGATSTVDAAAVAGDAAARAVVFRTDVDGRAHGGDVSKQPAAERWHVCVVGRSRRSSRRCMRAASGRRFAGLGVVCGARVRAAGGREACTHVRAKLLSLLCSLPCSSLHINVDRGPGGVACHDSQHGRAAGGGIASERKTHICLEAAGAPNPAARRPWDRRTAWDWRCGPLRPRCMRRATDRSEPPPSVGGRPRRRPPAIAHACVHERRRSWQQMGAVHAPCNASAVPSLTLGRWIGVKCSERERCTSETSCWHRGPPGV
eukprot:357759-Chlamydomonas_euryale.AAC.5